MNIKKLSFAFRSVFISYIDLLLYFCNELLFALPANQIRRLQSVQNAAARLIFNLRRSEHISDALINLHWLRIPERIRFKMAVLVYRALHGLSPSYLNNFAPLSIVSGRSNFQFLTSGFDIKPS